MKTRTWIAAVAVVVAGAGAALADDDGCEARVGDWQPRSAVVKMAEARGWTVQRIKTDDGCYEVVCTDAEGRRFEAIVDPVTLEVIATETRRGGHERRGEARGHDGDDHRESGESGRRGHGDHDDDDDDDEGGRVTPPAGPTDPNAPVPDNGLFNGKVRPKVQVQ